MYNLFMDNNSKKLNIFFQFGETHDSYLMKGGKEIENAWCLLNKKRFRVSDTDLTIINNRTKEEFKIEEEYIINFLDEKVSGEDE